MRDHSTEKQLKEKSLDARIILPNTLHALVLFIFSKFRVSVSFTRQNFSHMPTMRLARCSQPLPLVRSSTRALCAFLASVAPWPAYAGVLCGGRTTVAADREQNSGSTPFGAAQTPWWLRVAISSLAHACSTVAVAWHAQSAFSATDGSCGRSIEDGP